MGKKEKTPKDVKPAKKQSKALTSPVKTSKAPKTPKTRKAPSPSNPSPSSDDSSDEETLNGVAGKAEPSKPQKVNGGALDSSSTDSSSSESDSESESESGSESSASDKGPRAASAVSAKLGPKASDSDAGSDSDSDSESDDDAPTNGPKVTAAPSSDDDDSDDDSVSAADAKTKLEANESSHTTSSDSSDEDEDEDENKDEDVIMTNGSSTLANAPKRKADSDATPPSKKPKLEPSDPSSSTIWVGNLSWNVDDDWLRVEFEGYGEVVSARVQMDRSSGRSRGFGYVEFKDASAAQAATQDKNKEIDGRTPRTDIAPSRSAPDQAKRAKAFNDQTSEPSQVLFVGNLAFDASEDACWEAFGEFGEVLSVRLPTDRESQQRKGFGYVEFGDQASAVKAFEALQGKELFGRPVRLDYSQPRGPAGDGSRGRGGDRGRGGPQNGGRGGRGGGRGFRGGRGDFRGGRGDFRGGRGAGRGFGASRGRGAGAAAFEGKKTTF